MTKKRSIDVKALIAKLGGPTKFYELLVKAGHKITKSAVEKWSARESIPSDWLATVMDIAERSGKQINIADYVREKSTPDLFTPAETRITNSKASTSLLPEKSYVTGRQQISGRESVGHRLSHKLLKFMMERNLKQSDIAAGVFGRDKATNYPRGRDSVSSWVRGHALPQPRNLKKLADFLQVRPEDLLPPSQSHEDSTIELRQVATEPGMVQLRINRTCSPQAAAQILNILNKDDEKRRRA